MFNGCYKYQIQSWSRGMLYFFKKSMVSSNQLRLVRKFLVRLGFHLVSAKKKLKK